MEQATSNTHQGTSAYTKHHVAHLADSVIRQQPFQIMLNKRHHHRANYSPRANNHKQRVHSNVHFKHACRDPGQQINTKQLVQRRRQKSRYGSRRFLAAIRNPTVKWHGTGLGKRGNSKTEESHISQLSRESQRYPVNPRGTCQQPYNHRTQQQKTVRPANDDKAFFRGT